jgi:hypothetical protein
MYSVCECIPCDGVYWELGNGKEINHEEILSAACKSRHVETLIL